MKKEEFRNGLFSSMEDINEEMLLDAKDPKKHTQNIENSRRPHRTVMIAAAAVLVIFIMIPLALMLNKSPEPITLELTSSTNDGAAEIQSSKLEKPTETTESENIPQYIPDFTSPILDEVYATAPYSELLPRKLLSNCTFVSSYMTKYDPIANPDDSKFLSLVFKTGSELWETMEIKISKYDETLSFADINDKKTYALSYIYGNDSTPAGENNSKYSGFFHAQEISIDIVKEMVYTMSDGLCKAELSVLCDNYIVSYSYTGSEISADNFYDMVISSNWFSKYANNKT